MVFPIPMISPSRFIPPSHGPYRLKAILAQKGVPFDDIHEKSEFLTRIRCVRGVGARPGLDD